MPAQTSKTPGDGSGSLSYTLASDSFDIESVYVSVDATTATGPVTAELTVRDQSGVVIARKKQAATIPAGQTGSATWALRLDDEATGTAPAGGGIQFDTRPQDGGYLYVNTTGFDPLSGRGVFFGSSGGGIRLLNASSSTTDIDSTGAGAISITTNTTDIDIYAGNGVDMTADGATGIQLTASGSGDILLTQDAGTGQQVALNSLNSWINVISGGGIYVNVASQATWATTEKVNLGGGVRTTLGGPAGGRDSRFQIIDSTGAALFEVRSDGTFHIKTGAAWAADL